MKVSIVIPTLNEEKNIEILLNEIEKKDFVDEIIIVDGYSKDKTVEVTEKHGCKILYDDKGKGSALRKGLKEAKNDIVISMDADNSMLSDELYLLIAGIQAGYDVCMGSRFIQGGGTEDMSLLRKFGNKFFVSLVNIFWKTNYSDLCYGYRSFKKSSIDKIGLKSDDFGIETEISIKSAKLGLKVLEVPSFEKTRTYGDGKLRTFSDGITILKTITNELFNR